MDDQFKQINRLYEIAQQLQSRQTLRNMGFCLDSPRITIVSADRRVVKPFHTYMRSFATEVFPCAPPDIVTHYCYPELAGDPCKLGVIWILFSADRYELHSDYFFSWAIQHSTMLRQVPLMAIRIFGHEQAASWDEPIVFKSEEIRDIGQNINLISLLLNSEFTAGNAPAKALLKTLLLQSFHTHFHSVSLDKQTLSWANEFKTILAKTLNEIRSCRLSPPSLSANALTKVGKIFDAKRNFGSMVPLLDEFIDGVHKIDTVCDLAGKIVEYANEVALLLNDRRTRVNDQATWDVAESMDFSSEFQLSRRRFVNLAKDLSRECSKRGDSEQMSNYESVAQKLASDLKVILLGRFSCGKSTFLNTLLGLNDQKGALPTSGNPETATINVLEYVSQKQQECVQFHPHKDVISLQFFRKLGKDSVVKDYLQISQQEIQAFLRWLELGLIRSENLKIYRMNTISQSPAILKKDVEFLREIVRKNNFIYPRELETAGAPIRIDGIRFRTDHPNYQKLFDVSGKSIKECMEILRQPEVALALDHVSIKLCLKSLEGVSFVDTPGTDSIIPYHHTLAKSFIEKNPGALILYFFDASCPGGIGDFKNLSFLTEMKGVVERTFFLINKRDWDYSTADQTSSENTMVVNKVAETLRKAGIKGKPLYFIDSRSVRFHPGDKEWTLMTTDLKQFVDDNRTSSLKHIAWECIGKILKKGISDAQSHVKNLYSGQEERLMLAEGNDKLASAIRQVIDKFDKECRTAYSRLFRIDYRPVDEPFKEVIRDLDLIDCKVFRTKTKDIRLAEMIETVNQLNKIPSRMRDNLVMQVEYIHNFLLVELNKIGVNDVISKYQVSDNFNPLLLTKIKAKASEDITISWFRPKWYTEWLESKIKSLKELIRGALSDAKAAMENEFKAVEGHYLSVCKREVKKLEEQAASLRADSTRHEIAKEEDNRAFFEKWFNEYKALDKYWSVKD